MADFSVLEIKNSKKDAIKGGKWKNPGAKLYDRLLNAIHCIGDIPCGVEEMKKRIKDGTYANWDTLIKEAYLVAPVEKIKNSPHGVTPFSRSGCKYPHHTIRGNRLVVSIPGLRSAYICARNEGCFDSDPSKRPEYSRSLVAHLNKHCKELRLKPVWHHGEFYLMEENAVRIEENFRDISTVLFEKTGAYLFNNFFRVDDDERMFSESVIEGPGGNHVLTSDFTKEVGEPTPEALFKWMNKNITYDKTVIGWKLKNAAELYESKTGNCHDQSYFATFILHSWGYNPGQLFFVEFNHNSSIGGNTHTLTWFKRDKKMYWFENAWELMAGIHGPYDDLNALKQAVLDAYNNDDDINSNKFDGIVFGTYSAYKLGMSLGEYVGSWRLTDDREFAKYDPPLPLDQLPDHLKNDPVHRWRAENGIELIHKEPTVEELNRIWKNWNLMSDEMKRISDQKSVELFGVTNEQHYYQLISDQSTIAESISEKMTWIDSFVHDNTFRESVISDDAMSVSDLIQKCNAPVDLFHESVSEIIKINGIPDSHVSYTMKTLPKIMFFGSRNKHTTVHNKKLFLTPYMGIASIFVVDVSKALAEEFKKETGAYPTKLSCNSSTKEWNELEGPDLVRPLKKIHIYHNIKSLAGKTISGVSKGFIHCIDISGIRDDLKLYTTKDPDREVYYDGGKSLKPVEIIAVNVKWEMTYSETKAKSHGEGFIEAASVLGFDNDLEWMNTYMEAGEDNPDGDQPPETDDPPSLDEPEDTNNGESEPSSEDPPEDLPEVEESAEEPMPEPEPEATPTDPEPKQDESKKESMPKQTDRAESDKNGVRRKKLYIAFIEWCKEYNNKNTFGSIFDKDAFKVSYPFVPDEMRYFYRLANPMLCVLAGDLTFFPASDLRKINSKNKKLQELIIFAATPNDLRVFNIKDKKVYRATDKGGDIELHEVLGDTFDTYIQTMIQKGDILNGPIEESVDENYLGLYEY